MSNGATTLAHKFNIGQTVTVELPDGTPVVTRVRKIRHERSRWSRTGYIVYYAMTDYVGPSWVAEAAVKSL